MRKIIAIEFISLDGVMQSPGSKTEDTRGNFTQGGWIEPYADEISGKIIREQMNTEFDLLLGRRTFEIWSAYWPQNPHIWPQVESAKKYVVSTTLESHTWKNSVFIKNEVAATIKALKLQAGPNLHLYGSSELFQTLIQHSLVDELWLSIHPIIIGRGIRLFGDLPHAHDFTLSQSTNTTKGVIFTKYRNQNS